MKGQNAESNGSLDPLLDPVRLAHQVETYLPRPLSVSIGSFGKREPLRKRLERVRNATPPLSASVAEKICALDKDGLKRLSNAIEAINDNLITSTPENLNKFYGMPEYIKLMSWAYSLGTFSTDRLCKQWKKFSTLLKWKALDSQTPLPERPDDFPGFGSEQEFPATELPALWAALCPWLTSVWTRGVMSKHEATRLQHLVTGRNFPAGGQRTRDTSLRKHAETLIHTPSALSDDRIAILRRLSVLIGRSIKRNLPPKTKSEGHLSLTSSASIDSPVKDGGRAAEVSEKFRAWATRISDEDTESVTWFGQPYRLISGMPVWTTMCRESPVYDSTKVFADSAEDFILDFENFKYQDPLYGLDSATGFQILQWSIEMCIQDDILAGSFYKSENVLRKGGTVPSIRASTIGEPGAKSRVVTVGEDILTMVLQPFSHHLLGVVKTHPSVTTGLTRGWQGYEWVKRLRNVSPVPNQTTYFLSSDLTTATDFCTHEGSRAMFEGFLEGIGEQSPYLRACAELLCSGRIYETDLEDFLDSETVRGVLMGDPGAKFVLTMHNLCAEWESFIRYHLGMMETSDAEFLRHLKRSRGAPAKRWRHFVCSGDDHLAQGPIEYLRRITTNHALNGMSVSWPQNFISSRGAYYCEEMILTVNLDSSEIWGVDTPLHQRNYQSHPHIDAMKVRLLSPCAKEHEGKDEPNPAIGKARQIHGMLAWLGGGFEAIVPMVSARYEQRMKTFLPANRALRYLPIKLGGLGVPAFHLSELELRSIFRNHISENHKSAISRALHGSSTLLEQQTLATFATNARARGISSDLVLDQVRGVLSQVELTQGCTEDDLELIAQVDPTDFAHMRTSDKITLAKRHGLILVEEALNLIDRPYLFRNMLAPDVSRRHGIDPTPAAYDSRPWAVRELMLEKNLSQNKPEDCTTPVFETDLENLSGSVLAHGRGLEVPKRMIFVPEGVVVSETLCTLRTPL